MADKRSPQQIRGEILRERQRLSAAVGELREEALWGGQRAGVVLGAVVALVVVVRVAGALRRRRR
jgi:hypothetical protein